MTKVNAGNDMQARIMGGDIVGDANTGATVTYSATTLTDTGKSWTTNVWAGHTVVSGQVYGVIISNTGTVLTIDRWYAPATPGGTAGTTPSANAAYSILPGGPPAWYMALSATSTATSGSETTLAGEITTSGGGLIRKICPYAHTTSATTYTLTPVFTANGSDSLPVTIASIGVFNSLTSGQLLFRTVLGTTATLSASGDQLTITETVSM